MLPRMPTQKVTDAEYTQLDLAVALAEIAAGQLDVKISDAGVPTIQDAEGRWEPFRPTTNAAHGWTIIERERIPVWWDGAPGEGPVAAMRAFLVRGR